MSDLVAGVRLLGQGQSWVIRHRRWLGLGLLPALAALVVFVAGLVFLAARAGDIAVWATPFADSWDDGWQTLFRTFFALLLVSGGLLLTVLTFTAVTLLIGDPFYEALSEQVEEEEGNCPQGPDRPLWRELWLAVEESCYVLLWALLLALPLFVLGFVPLIGQTVVPVLALAVSGFFLTVELAGFALGRRGIPVRERLRLLRARPGLALGFGVPLVLLFLVPLGAVLLMPGAVAGATLLARQLVPSKDEPPEAEDEEGLTALPAG